MSNFIHPFSSCFIFLLFTHRLFFPGMIAHDHKNVKYAYYDLDFYPGDANHTVDSFATTRKNGSVSIEFQHNSLDSIC